MTLRPKKLAALTGGLLLALGGAVLPATAAHAAWPPGCVNLYGHTDLQNVLVVNNCSTTQSVKIIVDWGPDSNCTAIPSGYQWTYSWWPGDYDGMVSC